MWWKAIALHRKTRSHQRDELTVKKEKNLRNRHSHASTRASEELKGLSQMDLTGRSWKSFEEAKDERIK
jgi:hypothetical protein